VVDPLAGSWEDSHNAPPRIKLPHPVGRQPRAYTSISKTRLRRTEFICRPRTAPELGGLPDRGPGVTVPQQSDLEIRHPISSTMSWTSIRCPADTGPTSTVAGTSRRWRRPPCTSTTSVGSSDDCKIQRSRHLAVGVAVFLCDDKRRRQVRHTRGSQAGTPRQASAAGSMPDAVASGKSPESANSSAADSAAARAPWPSA